MPEPDADTLLVASTLVESSGEREGWSGLVNALVGLAEGGADTCRAGPDDRVM